MQTSISSISLQNKLLTAVLLIDSQQLICSANDAAEEFLEQSKNQLLGTPLKRWLREGEFLDVKVLKAVIDGKEIVRQESKVQLFSGKDLLVNFSLSKVFVEQRDYVLLELNQVHAAAMLTVNEKELGQHRQQRLLMRDLAHEIRNPLGGLRGAAQLLARQVNQKQQAYTDVILREADRLGQLVERVLGSGKPELRTTFNIHEVIEDVINLVVLDKPTAVSIKRDYDPSLPEFSGYRSSLYQAILNIARNAIQALEISGNEMKITTRAEHSVLLGREYSQMALRINISDNGPGVPEQLQQNLFMPMKSGSKDGTGIGLSIATTAVEQQGGCLKWTQQEDNTVFSIFLPFTKEKEVKNNG